MKKAKKIIIPVVLVLCLCAVCVLVFVNYREARKYQPPINGISWGMTSDEVIKKLHLSEDNVKEDEYGNIISYENATVFNQKANVQMFFDLDAKMNLSFVKIEFLDLNKDYLMNQLKSIYGTDFGKVYDIWISKKVMDLPEEIQDRFKYINIELPAKYNISPGFSEEGMWKSLRSQSLVSVDLHDSALTYDARYMAAYTIMKDDNKYNDWIEYLESLYKNRPEPASTAE